MPKTGLKIRQTLFIWPDFGHRLFDRYCYTQRRELARVLHNACIVDGAKINVMSAIDIIVESLKRIILDNSMERLRLPVIIPIENMEGITEWDCL